MEHVAQCQSLAESPINYWSWSLLIRGKSRAYKAVIPGRAILRHCDKTVSPRRGIHHWDARFWRANETARGGMAGPRQSPPQDPNSISHTLPEAKPRDSPQAEGRPDVYDAGRHSASAAAVDEQIQICAVRSHWQFDFAAATEAMDPGGAGVPFVRKSGHCLRAADSIL